MTEPQSIPLAIREASSHDPGVTDRETLVGGVRWALVEYRAGARRSRWCATPHSGYVVSGEVRYEFEDGREPLIAGTGAAFLLPAQPRHRGANEASETTRLFLIDALPGG